MTLLFVLACAAGCCVPAKKQANASDHQHRPATVPTTEEAVQAADRLDLLEAVFRWEFDHNASGGQHDYYFLSAEANTDPPLELLARFNGETPKVFQASMAIIDGMHPPKHKTLGGRGIIFPVDHIEWVDANTADVSGGYYVSGISASESLYRVERRGHKWAVTREKLLGIS